MMRASGMKWARVTFAGRPNSLSTSAYPEMPVLWESSVYPSGLAEATTCAPTWPAAPALVSTTTGCLRVGSVAVGGRGGQTALGAPGGNAVTMVIACEGNVSWANAGRAASAVAAVPITKRRRSMHCLLETDAPMTFNESTRMCSFRKTEGGQTDTATNQIYAVAGGT